jgi:FkbM family methyltransferase
MHARNTFPGVIQALKDIGWSPAGIIDIGVGQGTPGLYTTWPGTPICLVEPAPLAGQYVDQIVAMFPNVKAYKVGASNKSGTMTVRAADKGLFVSFGDHKQKWPEIEVAVMTCDEIVADAGMTGPFFYKLDTDAHEIEILKGSTKTLEAAEVVMVEMNFLYPVIGMAGPNDIWRLLADAGFTLFDMTEIRYSVVGVARQADAVFVKQDSALFNQLAWKNAAKAAKGTPSGLVI